MTVTAKNILYITYDGLTDPLGQSQVLPYLSGLRKKGHRITIVSAEKKERNTLLPQIQARVDSEGITWKRVSYSKKPPVISTVIDLWKIRRLCKTLCSSEKFDIVHCRSYLPALVGLYLKHKFNLAFIFDMRGFYADERVDGNIWDQHKFLYRYIFRFFKKKEKQFLSEADHVISLTVKAKNEIHSWKDVAGQPVRIQIIPCCADMELFKPQDQSAGLKKKLGLENFELVISYAGSIGTWYMLSEMLDFFKRLLVAIPNSCFLFITPDKPEWIKEEVAKRGIDPEKNIRVVNAQYREVPGYLSCSNISIFFIKPTFSKSASSPTKQAEILAVGIPIICNAGIGDTDSIILDSKAGAVIQSFSTEEYERVIGMIPSLLKIPPSEIRKYALSHLSLESAVEKYAEVYELVG